MGKKASVLAAVGWSLARSCEALAVPVAGDECTTSWPGWAGIKYMFTFGDSYTQTGFNVGGTQPNAGNPLGNPPYPGWTSCNGPNWVDFLTTEYNRSSVLTYNLADGGATIDGALIKPWKPEVESLIDQVRKRYVPNYAKKPAHAPWTSGNALFGFWIGINDVGNTYWDANSSRVETAFKEYEQILEEVYATGARNFLFLNVPPLQRAPLTAESTTKESVEREEKAIEAWNGKLVRLVDVFFKNHPDTTTFLFSVHDIFHQILDYAQTFPQTAGLMNTKNFCSGYASTPPSLTKPASGCKYALSEYFWVNNLHPTYPVHNATAAELGRALEGFGSNLGKKCGDNTFRSRYINNAGSREAQQV